MVDSGNDRLYNYANFYCFLDAVNGSGLFYMIYGVELFALLGLIPL